ncbi:hypothetical protein GGX14DRAFT_656022 [Mycena pura]|uniref:Uncharacterized protein n=1 Tax=Mycena pura TaxID=153505 RepID=A0AAD6YBS8_9AGAR|nr:hypothetical protein GGX14DRAFT_656022 [Mycena pura]
MLCHANSSPAAPNPSTVFAGSGSRGGGSSATDSRHTDDATRSGARVLMRTSRMGRTQGPNPVRMTGTPNQGRPSSNLKTLGLLPERAATADNVLPYTLTPVPPSCAAATHLRRHRLPAPPPPACAATACAAPACLCRRRLAPPLLATAKASASAATATTAKTPAAAAKAAAAADAHQGHHSLPLACTVAVPCAPPPSCLHAPPPSCLLAPPLFPLRTATVAVLPAAAVASSPANPPLAALLLVLAPSWPTMTQPQQYYLSQLPPAQKFELLGLIMPGGPFKLGGMFFVCSYIILMDSLLLSSFPLPVVLAADLVVVPAALVPVLHCILSCVLSC